MKVLIVRTPGEWVRIGDNSPVETQNGLLVRYKGNDGERVIVEGIRGYPYRIQPSEVNGEIVDETDPRGQSTQDPAYTLFKDEVVEILDALDFVDGWGAMTPEKRKLRTTMSNWLNSVTADMVD